MATGVIIVNLGTPDSPNRYDVYKYLREFLTDPRVIDYPWLLRQFLVQCIIAPFRSKSSARLYERLWTEDGSPLKVYGEDLTRKVQEQLGNAYVVRLAMRYQSPSIEKVIDELGEMGLTRIVVFTLFPQYASATIGSVMEKVMRIFARKTNIPELRLLGDYHNDDGFIEAFKNRFENLDLSVYGHIIFSYHGLPERQIRAADQFDHCLSTENCCSNCGSKNALCYRAQCFNTSRLLAKKLKLEDSGYSVSFQSRLGTEQWTQPYTTQIIEDRAKRGDKRLLVCCPAFTSDCLETTIEIGYEYNELFQNLGGESLELVESLNAHDDWAEWVASYIRKNNNNSV